MSKTIYRETQRFRRWEVLGLLLLLLLVTSYHFVELQLAGRYDDGSLWLQYALVFLIVGGFLFYLFSIRLILKIDEDKIRYQFFPLHYKKHKIRWDDVEECEVIDTPAATELSGWAVRLGTRERMFSVSGRTGLCLTLKDGQQLFIGTKHPERLKKAIQEAKG